MPIAVQSGEVKMSADSDSVVTLITLDEIKLWGKLQLQRFLREREEGGAAGTGLWGFRTACPCFAH